MAEINWQSLSQSHREALLDSLKKQSSDDTTTYVDVTGDTMTGALNVPTVAMTSTASIAGALNLVGSLNARSAAFTSNASVSGTFNVAGTLGGQAVAFTSTVSVAGTLVGSTALFASSVSMSGSLDLVGGADVRSNATLTTPLIAQHETTIAGGPTIAPIRAVASTASQSFFDFRGAVISTASINIAANQTAGVIQVYLDGEAGPAIGYIPIYKGVV